MPSELDDLVFVSSGPANKPEGLTFDDVPMIANGPNASLDRFGRFQERATREGVPVENHFVLSPDEIFLRHVGFRPLVQRLASVEPTAAAMRRYDPDWRDDLAALVTSDPQLSSRRMEPGSISRSSALGPWNIFVGPENPDRPSYMMEPTLQEQQEGGIAHERLPKETYGDDYGVVRYRDTGQPVPIVARPGLLPLVGTPEGVKVALPRLIDLLLQAGGGASAPAQAPKAVRVGAQAAGGRAARPVVDAARDRLQAPSDSAPSQALSPGFHPPPAARRDFSADYPNGAPANDKGQLLVDMDGYSLLGAKRIMGRQTLGGSDRAVVACCRRRS